MQVGIPGRLTAKYVSSALWHLGHTLGGGTVIPMSVLPLERSRCWGLLRRSVISADLRQAPCFTQDAPKTVWTAHLTSPRRWFVWRRISGERWSLRTAWARTRLMRTRRITPGSGKNPRYESRQGRPRYSYRWWHNHDHSILHGAEPLAHAAR